ncbi:MAG: hypothetical protein CM1200mP16_12860 [Nitrospina sp.]|nr:MAG: hypothetical protein CM1200mP16_12860 [Nitrospina sp.]
MKLKYVVKNNIYTIIFAGNKTQKKRPMINSKRVCVVMPSYNAEKTLQKTYDEIPKKIVGEIILTDDASKDRTVEVAKSLGIKTFVHNKIEVMEAIRKTRYKAALDLDADITIMLHPDYQYTPKLITAMGSRLQRVYLMQLLDHVFLAIKP